MAHTFGSDALADTIAGGLGADTIFGGADGGTGGGDDVLTGGTGIDLLFGGLGDDTLNADGDDAVVVGGAGNDTAVYTSGVDVVTGAHSIVAESVLLDTGNDTFAPTGPAAVGSMVALSSLTGAAGFRLAGALAGDSTGSAVSSAGDVNGDGIDDLIVGAHQVDAAGSNSGAAYVVFGKTGGWTADVALSSIDGATGFRLTGVGASDGAGFSVAAVGDVNRDGIDDLIVGANGADNNGSASGSAYVVFGKTSGWTTDVGLSSLDGTTGFRLDGAAAGDEAGWAASAAGDVNGDGFDDLVVGARGVDANGGDSGASYVVFGKSGGWTATVALASVNGTTGFRLPGAATNDEAGNAVASAGDVNGDGIDDLIVSAHQADPNGANSGAAYVVFGKAGGWTTDFSLASLNGTAGFRLTGAAAGDRAADSVASAGDVNGDGFDDLIVGVSQADANGADAGASYVVFGKASGWTADVALSSVNGVGGFRLVGGAAGDQAGLSAAAAGDLNGDGYADLIVGAYRADANGADSGATYVVFGKSGGWTTDVALSALNGTSGIRLAGAAASDLAGGSVASAGDVNGDGFDDLLIGAAGAAPNGAESGAAYVVFGGAQMGLGTAGVAYTVYGGAGDDVVTGEAARDTLYGGADNDMLSGGGGSDILAGGVGNDTLDGGSGSDRADYGAAAAAIVASLATGVATGEGSDTLIGVESVSGGSGDDTLTGDAGGNLLSGGAGADTLYGAGGFDVVAGEANNDVLYGVDDISGPLMLFGGEGDDVLNLSVVFVGGLASTLHGDAGTDKLVLDFSAQSAALGRIGGGSFMTLMGSGAPFAAVIDVEQAFVVGGSGNDDLGGFADASTLEGRDGGDVLQGSSAGDSLYGGAGADTLTGSGGLDTLFGEAGDDVLSGDDGVDTLYGGGGRDNLYAGAGNDALFAVADQAGGVVRVDGGDGDDLLAVTVGAVSSWTVSAAAGSGTDRLNADFSQLTGPVLRAGPGGPDGTLQAPAVGGQFVFSGVDQVYIRGGGGSDVLHSFAGASTLEGGGNADTLAGSSAVDTLYGGAGNDALNGLAGADRMAGGDGDDVFTVDNLGDVIDETAVGSDGTDTVIVGVNDYTLSQGVDVASLANAAVGATIGAAGDTDNRFNGGTGNDRFDGGAGNDRLFGGGGDDALYGGEGDDTLNADVADHVVAGGAGSDTVVYGAGDDTILGDRVVSADTILLGSGNDVFSLDPEQSALLAGDLHSVRLNAESGWTAEAVAAVGDVNDDGIDDFIVGSAQGGSGAAYVVFGRTGGWTSPLDLGALDGSDGFRLYGGANQRAGGSVSEAGDVNGDGIDDLLVGSRSGESGGGTTWVVFGKSGSWDASLDLTALTGTNGYALTGSANGWSVAGIGDVNDDGVDDLAVGSPSHADNGGAAFAGRAYIVYGTTTASNPSYDIASLPSDRLFALFGGNALDDAGNRLGYSVAAAGDVDGDDIADVVVSYRGASINNPSGYSVVLFGKTGGWSTLTEGEDFAVLLGRLTPGGHAYDRVGASVSSAGDVNGDGFDDLIVGGDGGDQNGDESGLAYVVFGHGGSWTSPLQLPTLNGSNGFRLYGDSAGDRAGYAVSSGGDLNGDGYGDLLVGAPGEDAGGTDRGAAYVILGKASGWSASITLGSSTATQGVVLPGAVDGAGYGSALASAGDVDGDGRGDLLISGAVATDSDGYLLFGGAQRRYNIDGGGGADTVTGGALDDTLAGGDANDALYGAEGADTLTGGDGGDSLVGGDGSDTADFGDAAGAVTVTVGAAGSAAGAGGDTLVSIEHAIGGVGADTLFGDGSGNGLYGGLGGDSLFGGGGNDLLNGGDDDDVLDAGAGALDSVIGGAGSDRLVADFSTATSAVVVTGSGSSGTISGVRGGVANTIAFSLVEVREIDGGSLNDTLQGGTGADTLDGAGGNDGINGGSGDDVVDGGLGVDVLSGVAGNDLVYGGDGTDSLYGAADNDVLYGGLDGDRMYGGVGLDTLYGGDGADTLDGGTDVDRMAGGAGDDRYAIDSALDIVDETSAGSGGTDTVFTSVGGLTLGAAIEQIFVSGTVGLTLTAGGATNNLMTGGNGADHFFGGGGDDTQYGGSGDDKLFGGTGIDTLFGGAGIDTLEGQTGADVVAGGAGNDVYFVNDLGDVVDETSAGSAGTDTINVSVDGYQVAVNIERINVSGALGLTVTALGATANTLNGAVGGDELDAGDGADHLFGGAGADTLWGAAGNDKFYGGDDADTLYGGAGLDSLTGGAGADRMAGGAGIDIYFVDDVGDAIDETAVGSDGADTVYVSANDYHLSQDVERANVQGVAGLTITADGSTDNLLNGGVGNDVLDAGAGNDILYGNDADDALLGGLGNDKLFGGDGADSLSGGAGVDTLTGGLGADSMAGGEGIDFYYVDDAGDVVDDDGTSGLDTVFVSSGVATIGEGAERINVTAAGGSTVTAQGATDNLVYGGGGGDSLYGGGGADKLYGGGGADDLSGGDGIDSLVGGLGADTLSGGSGNDRFLKNAGEGDDTIADFGDGTDKVDLVGITVTTFAGTVVTLSDGTQITASNGHVWMAGDFV